MNKAVNDDAIHIVGAGIAGLTAGICLARLNQKVVIYERREQNAFEGMGFLLAKNGVDALKSLFGETWPTEDFYLTLESLTLNNIENQQSIKGDAQGMWGVLRPPLIQRLKTLYIQAGGVLLNDHTLINLEFDKNSGRVNTLSFRTATGLVEQKVKIALGADGINSQLRRSLFPKSSIQSYPMTEFVGISSQSALSHRTDTQARELVKYYSPQRRLAFGYMYLPDHKVIWYAQMLKNDQLPTQDGMKRQNFLINLFQDWPKEIHLLLQHCDFTRTYRWDLKDSEVIPSAYKSGIALIGDAAHASLTLSSQGVASAIEDAKHLAQCLESLSLNRQCTLAIWDQVCEHFNAHQHEIWQRRQKEARGLQRKFMDAELANTVPVVNT